MNSRVIVLWLDERWYQALKQQLEVEKLEDTLNKYLDNLISLLPAPVYDTIMEEIREDCQQQTRQSLADYSAQLMAEDITPRTGPAM